MWPMVRQAHHEVEAVEIFPPHLEPVAGARIPAFFSAQLDIFFLLRILAGPALDLPVRMLGTPFCYKRRGAHGALPGCAIGID